MLIVDDASFYCNRCSYTLDNKIYYVVFGGGVVPVGNTDPCFPTMLVDKIIDPILVFQTVNPV